MLSPSAGAALKGRRTATTARLPTPAFVVEPGKSTLVPGGMLRGFAVAAAQSDAGDRIVREDGIGDPASYVARRLREDLQRRYGL